MESWWRSVEELVLRHLSLGSRDHLAGVGISGLRGGAPWGRNSKLLSRRYEPTGVGILKRHSGYNCCYWETVALLG